MTELRLLISSPYRQELIGVKGVGVVGIFVVSFCFEELCLCLATVTMTMRNAQCAMVMGGSSALEKNEFHSHRCRLRSKYQVDLQNGRFTTASVP